MCLRFILLTLLFTFNGQPTTPPVGAGVIGGSSADRYGFKPHDEIVSIDGRTIRDFEDIRREMTISLDQQRVFKIKRNGEIMTIRAQPEKNGNAGSFRLQAQPRHAWSYQCASCGRY
jgi:regulator of sigma E protease